MSSRASPPPLSPPPGPDGAAAAQEPRVLSAQPPGWAGQSLRDPARLAAIAASGLREVGGRDPGLNRVARLAARALHAPVALVKLVTEDADIPVAWHASDPERWCEGAALDDSYCQHVVASGEALAVSDSRLHPLLRDNRATTELGVVAYLAVPLRAAGGEVLGSVCVIDREAREWGHEHVATLEDVAALAADEVVLQAHAWTAERAAREAAEQSAALGQRLHAVTAALTAARSPREVARIVVSEGARAFGAPVGAVGLLTDDGASFELAAAHNMRPSDVQRWARFPNAGDLPFPTVVRTLEPLWVSTPAEIEARHPEIAGELADGRIRAYAALPLVVSGERGERRPLGAIIFDFDEARDFSGEDRAFLLAMAQVAAQALERASLDEAERSARERLTDTLERMAEGFFAFDADWQCEYVNAAGRHMIRTVGGNPDAVVGRNAWQAFPPLVGTPLQQAMLDAVRERRPIVVEDVYRGVWVECQVVPSEGHVAVYLRDVTERRRAEAERERLLEAEQSARRDAEVARAAAEAASQAKSEFLAVMSHELRTPLNAIGGYAELLEMGVRGPVTAEQLEDLRRIQKSQKHLLGLINQVLSYARIDAGALAYDLADFSVDEALRGSEGLIAPQIAARALVFRYDGCGEDVRVHADAEKLQQIVLNLLSNAVKFTPEGGSIILACETAGAAVLIRVHDTGIGIPPDKLASVFEPFVQADPSHTRTQQGVGLGLSISRTLAEAMSGSLVVERTALRAGTTFRLTLPRGR